MSTEIDFTIEVHGKTAAVTICDKFVSWQYADTHPAQMLMNALSSAAEHYGEPEPMDIYLMLMLICGALQHNPYEFVSLRGRITP